MVKIDNAGQTLPKRNFSPFSLLHSLEHWSMRLVIVVDASVNVSAIYFPFRQSCFPLNMPMELDWIHLMMKMLWKNESLTLVCGILLVIVSSLTWEVSAESITIVILLKANCVLNMNYLLPPSLWYTEYWWSLFSDEGTEASEVKPSVCPGRRGARFYF